MPLYIYKKNNFIIPYNPVTSTVLAYYIVQSIALYTLSNITTTIKTLSATSSIHRATNYIIYLHHLFTLSIYTIHLYDKQQLYNKQYTPYNSLYQRVVGLFNISIYLFTP